MLQPRCEIKLRSGTTLTLRPPVQPADPATIRARALSAIPPQYLTAAMLEETVAPILAALAPSARRFYAESKRVSNARAKAELGWRPAYPTYREGLAAVLKAGG